MKKTCFVSVRVRPFEDKSSLISNQYILIKQETVASKIEKTNKFIKDTKC